MYSEFRFNIVFDAMMVVMKYSHVNLVPDLMINELYGTYHSKKKFVNSPGNSCGIITPFFRADPFFILKP